MFVKNGKSTQGHTGISGKVKDEAGEEGEEHAGDDDVDDEVEWQPQHEEVVGDVQVGGVWAAGVVHPVLPSSEILHHPLPALHEVTQIRAIAVLGAHVLIGVIIPLNKISFPNSKLYHLEK